ncbi:threonine synthase [Saprospiraceae bacterium]|nr:threonine synthase [Saprospiraceae bacterium]
MKLYSTNDKNNIVDLKKAVLNAFPKDKGLYMPISIPKLDSRFLNNLYQYSLIDIAFIVSQNLIGNYIPEADLYKIVSKAINFPAPVHTHDNRISALELFHGPSMAFKDFGARYMAELMSYFLRNEDRETTILVATSGDTGGAVAAGFHNVPGINVIILYPSGKVSPLQEKQLTTWGDNIKAIEVNGVFDDCQALVKEAFLDDHLKEKYTFSSANSINIARLIPQSFYYFEGYKQVQDKAEKIVFSIPSGNFGNLTAGLLAYQMGLPVSKFLAATNINDTVPSYLSSGKYEAKASVQTISNAMDVGAPSNFTRMQHLFGDDSSTWNNMKKLIKGYTYNDMQTKKTMKSILKKYNYIADPHGAIGYQACVDYLSNTTEDVHAVYLETAHPGKFGDVVEDTLGNPLILPKSLSKFLTEEKVAYNCDKEYTSFKKLLMSI